jgi:hypothetical protein
LRVAQLRSVRFGGAFVDDVVVVFDKDADAIALP